MTIQRTSQSFRVQTLAPGLNVEDLVYANGTNGWTYGSGLIDLVNFQVPVGPKWSVLSVSILAGLTARAIAGSLSYGKFGKIIGGFAPTGLVPTTGAPALAPTLTNTGIPLPQLPSDEQLTAPLWDPATDPMPPITSGALATGQKPTTLLPIMCTLAPPQPIPLNSESLCVGIWMTPSLLSPFASTTNSPATALAVWNASYEVTYDDGS